MGSFDHSISDNKRLWETWTPLHTESAFYDVQGFKEGKSTLGPIELEELGDVQEKSLLHLQCHFGLDTLSLARKGAIVTGVDISEKSVDFAKSLADELNLSAEFIACNLYDLPHHLEGQFDIVFTSYGTIVWLPELRPWAEIVARYLKPGGTFVIVDFHPFMRAFDDLSDTWVLKHPYFYRSEPSTREAIYTYAGVMPPPRTAHVWAHPISEIINSLLDVGLELQSFKEYPYATRAHCPALKRINERYWAPSDPDVDLPCMYSLKARKKAEG